MTFLFGRGWVLQNKAGEEAGGGAGADTTVVDGDEEVEGQGGEKKPAPGLDEAAGEKKEEGPKDMKAAIDAGLGYAKKPGEGEEPGAKKVTETPGEKKLPAGASAPFSSYPT